MKPKISDAAGWEETHFSQQYKYVVVSRPTGLTIANPQYEKRFSFVGAEIALRNWYKVSRDATRDKYFYGERAYDEARNYAHDLECKLELDINGLT